MGHIATGEVLNGGGVPPPVKDQVCNRNSLESLYKGRVYVGNIYPLRCEGPT